MADFSRPLKIEAIASGGDENDYFPTEFDPAEDIAELYGISLGDQVTTITKDGSNNIQFVDSVTGTKALKDIAYKIQNLTSTGTAGTASVILCDATSAAFTVNLPNATTNNEKVYFIKKVDSSANKVTIDGNGTQTIDGSLTQDLKKGEALTIISDGSNWQVL